MHACNALRLSYHITHTWLLCAWPAFWPWSMLHADVETRRTIVVGKNCDGSRQVGMTGWNLSKECRIPGGNGRNWRDPRCRHYVSTYVGTAWLGYICRPSHYDDWRRDDQQPGNRQPRAKTKNKKSFRLCAFKADRSAWSQLSSASARKVRVKISKNKSNRRHCT